MHIQPTYSSLYVQTEEVSTLCDEAVKYNQKPLIKLMHILPTILTFYVQQSSSLNAAAKEI